jgi:hypothetical protein
MKTSTLAHTALLLAASAALPACASSSTQDGSRASGATQAGEAPAPSATLAGTWAFVLEASDVADAIRARCAEGSGGDATKSAACFAEVREEASREKIRFRTAEGRTRFSSFADEGGKETLFFEAPVNLRADGSAAVLVTIAGAASGPRASELAGRQTDVVRVDVEDPRTIAMNDPKKGRLVYTRE